MFCYSFAGIVYLFLAGNSKFFMSVPVIVGFSFDWLEFLLGRITDTKVNHMNPYVSTEKNLFVFEKWI